MTVTGMTEVRSLHSRKNFTCEAYQIPQQYGEARRECAAVSKGKAISYSDCLQKNLKEQSLVIDNLFPESHSKV